jgi:hypothetical protein
MASHIGSGEEKENGSESIALPPLSRIEYGTAQTTQSYQKQT